MTTEFDDLFADQAADVLMQWHAESIIYEPSGGSQRTIDAMVDRSPLDEMAEVQQLLVPNVVIEVRNHATLGIASATLNVGGDRVKVALWEGQTPQWLPIVKRMSAADAGLLQLQCGG